MRKPYRPPPESWHELTRKIEMAKIELQVARRKIRSDSALINFKNFAKGFAYETGDVAFIAARDDWNLPNPTTDYNVIMLMAKGAMAIYGRIDPKDPVSTKGYWDVKLPPIPL